MALDAANEKLAGYYARVGYYPTSDPIVMPTGERSVVMCRWPSPSPGVLMERLFD